jgi:PAS domain S-box-containing protein
MLKVDMKTIRIVLVDDSPDFLDSASRFLADQPELDVVGFARSGPEAIHQVDQLRPDVVIMDLVMPGMTGVEATRWIKGRPSPPRVVVVSMHDDLEFRQAAEEAGADAYLSKLEFASRILEVVGAVMPRRAIRVWDPGAYGLRMLGRLTHTISTSLDLDEALGAIARIAGESFSTPFVAFWLADAAGTTLTLRAWWDESGGPPYPRRTASQGHGDVGWVAANRLALTVIDVGTDPWVLEREWFRGRGLTSLLGVPVTLGGQLLAVLTLATREPIALCPERQDLLDGFVFQAALAIRSARLDDESRRAQDFLRSISEATADAIVAIDVAGRVTHVAGRAAELFASPPDRLLGRNVQEAPACWQEGSWAFADLARRLAAGETVTNYETTLRTPDGRRRETRSSIAPLRDATGAVSGGVAVVRDVTERRRTERTLEQAAKLALAGSWLAGVAHELNDPLTAVVAQAEVLQIEASQRGEPALSEMAGRILESATWSSRVVRAFLGLARYGTPVRRPVAINDVVSTVLDLMAAPLACHRIEVESTLAPDLSPVAGDADQLHQVVIHLVSNAMHALREAPQPRRLLIDTRPGDSPGRIVLEVADSGPGVPAALNGLIFEPFVTTRPKGEAAGLGLALCRRFVTALGGTIRAGRAATGGAVFTVELPAVQG